MTETLSPAILILCLLVPLVLCPAARGQDHGARVQWLRENAAVLHPLSTDSEPGPRDADLAPLRRALAGVRVVALGEQTHGDGACFRAKVRLCRFLHRELGFDVLAFESGMFGCRKAWEGLRAGEEPVQALSRGVFGIWTQSAQVTPLASYLARCATTERPLDLCGFDCQVTGSARTSLVRELEVFARKLEPPAVDAATWKVLRVGLGKLLATPLEPVSAAARAELRQALDTLRVGLAKPEVQRARDARMVEFWRQLAASLSGFAAYALAPRAERGPLQINPRDAQMGDNLVWLANQHYRGRKIIVWAATMHIARNLPSIDTEDEDLDYRGVKSMGQHAFAALGKELYALGFVAYQGRAGISWGKPWDLGRAPAGSLEDLCQRAGLDQAFLDFRGLPREHWLRGALSSRPLGHRPMVARWPDVIDGVVFQRVMTPSTMRVVEQGGAGDDARRSKRKRKDR